MSQGVSVRVRDIYNWNLRNTSVSGGGSCVTDTGGCWYETPVGGFTIRATHTGYISESQRVSVGTDEWINVYFDAAHGHAMYPSIMGIVHDESDEPLANMFVWGAGTLGNTKSWGCFTNSSGSYSLPIHSAGSYVIYCGKNNYEMISNGNYSQESAYPTTTTTINFTGDYSASRIGETTPKLAIHNKSVVIGDDLSTTTYFYNSDEPDTGTVYAKTRILKGSYLNTYIEVSDDEEVPDGYGGSEYE